MQIHFSRQTVKSRRKGDGSGIENTAERAGEGGRQSVHVPYMRGRTVSERRAVQVVRAVLSVGIDIERGCKK